MIKIERETVYGLEKAIRGMRDEWRRFCKRIGMLPHSESITCNGNETDNKKASRWGFNRIDVEGGENGRYYLELPDGYRLIYDNNGYVGRYNPEEE